MWEVVDLEKQTQGIDRKSKMDLHVQHEQDLAKTAD